MSTNQLLLYGALGLAVWLLVLKPGSPSAATARAQAGVESNVWDLGIELASLWRPRTPTPAGPVNLA